MNALLIIAPIYFILLIFYGLRNFKMFLLMTGILSMPLRTTYSFYDVGTYEGWTNGIILSLSDTSFIILFFYLVLKRQHLRIPLRLSKPILCLIGACSLSLLNSTWIKMTFFQIFLLSQAAFLYYFVALNSIETKKEISQITLFILISTLFQGVLSVAQYGTGYEFDLFSTGKSLGGLETLFTGDLSLRRASGTVLRPNGFAAFIAPLLNFCFAIFYVAKIHKKFAISAAFFGSLGLVFSFSRGGWLSLVVSLLFLMVVMIKRKVVVLGAIILASIMVLFIFSFSDEIRSRVYGDDQNSFNSRLPLNEIAINMYYDHPLIGIRTNTFRSIIRSYLDSLQSFNGIYLNVVHNQYLLLLSEAGLIGLGAYVWLLTAFFREAWSCVRIKNNVLARGIGMGITGGFVAIAVHGLVEAFLGSQLGLNEAFFMCSICSATRKVFSERI